MRETINLFWNLQTYEHSDRYGLSFWMAHDLRVSFRHVSHGLDASFSYAVHASPLRAVHDFAVLLPQNAHDLISS